MSLSHVRGPLGTRPAGWFDVPVPSPVTYVEPHPRRVQGWRAGRAVVDTEQALLVHRPGQVLSYAFPRAAVPDDVPAAPEPAAEGYVRVPWDAVDAWHEEGRVLRSYPPNPYHRVDCRPTRRRLRVEVAGHVLVDTEDTVVLFETGLPPLLYVHPQHVRTDLLERSGTATYCNYKGDAGYWSARVGGTLLPDVAWSYEDPLPESTGVRGHLAFDASRTTVLAELPGEPSGERSGEPSGERRGG